MNKVRKNNLLLAVKQLKDAIMMNKPYIEIQKKIDLVCYYNDSRTGR